MELLGVRFLLHEGPKFFKVGFSVRFHVNKFRIKNELSQGNYGNG